MEIMKPIASSHIPAKSDFLYEVKYDGFRAVLHWEKGNIRLTSRNNKDLTNQFPEIIRFCTSMEALINKILPIQIDGELVVLNNVYQANFSWIQKRGRAKSHATIQKYAETRPATFLAYDLLQYKGESYRNLPYQERKAQLETLFKLANWKEMSTNRLGYIKTFKDPDHLRKLIFTYKGEGIIAKRKKSLYQVGKQHHDWYKVKNWRSIHGFLTYFDINNEYFTVSVYHDGAIKEIGKCKHGLDVDTFATVKEMFVSQGDKKGNGYSLPPAICAEIFTLDLVKDELREPNFSQVLPSILPKDCTEHQLNLDLAMFPPSIELTNTEKVFWPETNATKGDLLIYLRNLSPYMLPYLNDRALTVIRCPDGVEETFFFQKQLPSYAPTFMDYVQIDEKNLTICNHLESLIWLANHGAIEYHVPFQTVKEAYPTEIAFDLDPPDREHFDLAIHASLLIKQILDDLELISFIKTSGNKGLQIHIPLPKGKLAYEDTAIFTEAIALTIEGANPTLFTTERLKKNRNNRLYIDYLQHGKDKTLIAPYSPRKTSDATVATPLFWEEVKEGLIPDLFTMPHVSERINMFGCPFTTYFESGEKQKLTKLLALINR